MVRYPLLLLVLIASTWRLANAQNNPRLGKIASQLDTMALRGVPVGDTISISMEGPLPEFAAFLAQNGGLNLSVDPGLEMEVAVSFTDAVVRDVLLYLCDAYNLELSLIGNIVRVRSYRPPPPVPVRKPLSLSYDSLGHTLTLRLQSDTLEAVARELSRITGENIVLASSVRQLPVSGFVNAAPLPQVLRQLTESNDLTFEEREEFFFIGPPSPSEPSGYAGETASRISVDRLQVRKVADGKLTIKAVNVDVLDLIRETALQAGADFHLLPEPAETDPLQLQRTTGTPNRIQPNEPPGSGRTISLQLKTVTFEEVLSYVCRNSHYTYQLIDNTYVIGRRRAEGLRKTELFKFQHRSAKGVLAQIPQGLQDQVQIDSLYELNALILSGSENSIHEITDFLREVDQLVPVVLIELIIIDVQTNRLNELGVEMGVAEGGLPSGGTLISGTEGGGLDFTLSTGSINGILEFLAGRNIVNLGQVNANFYLSLRAVEENGIVEVLSTPRLSTLNSHKANLSIGERRYYLEQQVSFPGNDRPIPIQSNTFQSVDANLFIDILPMVSGEEHVTLEIFFEQSEFIAAPSNAPPPQVSRTFESMIRVKDGEMIALGGLERESKAKTSSGLPFFSRIPLIGWLFGKKRKSKSKNKLLIFVRPTVMR